LPLRDIHSFTLNSVIVVESNKKNIET